MSNVSVFKNLLKKNSLDGFIFSTPQNISYLTNIVNPDAYLLVSSKGLTYFTDSRYIEEVRAKLDRQVDLKKVNGSVFKLIAQGCVDLGLKRVGFQDRYLPYAEFRKIKEFLKGKACLLPSHGLIERLRLIKYRVELGRI